MLKQFVDKCTVKLKSTAIRRTLSVLAVTAVLIGFSFRVLVPASFRSSLSR